MKSLPITRLLALATLASLAAAQSPVPRPSVEIDTASTGNAFFFSLASEADLSALVFDDRDVGGSHKIFASITDGRGVDWSGPVEISNDPGSARKLTAQSSCRIVGNTIYASWVDERAGNGSQDLYLNVSLDRGLTWLGETRVPNPAPGLGTLNDKFDFEVVAGGTGPDRLYLSFDWQPVGGFLSDVYLVKSTDGGASFGAPIAISQNAGMTSRVSKHDLEVVPGADAASDQVHFVWYDNAGYANPAVELYRALYQRSLDGGSSWLATDNVLAPNNWFWEGNFYDRVGVAVEGGVVAIFWQAVADPMDGRGSVHARVSEDGGSSFGPDEIVGRYVPDQADIDRVSMAISEGNVILAWNDNRAISDQLFVQRRAAGTGVWTETQVTNGPGQAFGAELSFAGREGVILGAGPGYPNGPIVLRTSDAGATWGPALDLGDHPLLDLIIIVDGVYNPLYDNVLMAWNVENLTMTDRSLLAGGFRPQTLTPVGFNGLTGTGAFQYSGFDPGVDTFAFTAMSLAPGDLLLPFASQRNLGLGLGPLLFDSLGPHFGMTSTTLDAAGAGVSSTIAYQFPAALTFYAVGVGFDFTPGDIVGRMTDVVRVDVP
ncbi:MAG: hypothetical protein WD226_01730 [Planctomycetota bacterium]